ncbi:MAG: hypothetical protein K6D94_06290 [Clostridiales bacterium]|nr:hypothetical protein [Clostridiales bacterium]
MVFVIIAAAAAVYILGYALVSLSNFRNNSEAERTLLTSQRTVSDQNGDTGMSFRYGLYKARHNACEAIAVHNVKILLGRPSRLTDVIRRFQTGASMIGLGFFGSNVYMIGLALRREKIGYKRVRFADIIEDGLYILCFWNKGAPWHGIHTVAALNRRGKWTSFNLHGWGTVYTESPMDYAKNFICGYRITDYDEQKDGGSIRGDDNAGWPVPPLPKGR